MTRLGVVLAAGNSTRLPHKCLLPDREGRPVMMQAIDFSFLFAEECAAVVQPVSAERDWISSQEYAGVILTARPTGLCTALTVALEIEASEYLVTFGDNIYDGLSNNEVPVVGTASVRNIDNSELDGYDFGKWQYRETYPIHKLAGWICCYRKQLETIARATSLIGGMNAADIKPHYCDPSLEWWDIGTYDSYAAYLRREEMSKRKNAPGS